MIRSVLQGTLCFAIIVLPDYQKTSDLELSAKAHTLTKAHQEMSIGQNHPLGVNRAPVLTV